MYIYIYIHIYICGWKLRISESGFLDKFPLDLGIPPLTIQESAWVKASEVQTLSFVCPAVPDISHRALAWRWRSHGSPRRWSIYLICPPVRLPPARLLAHKQTMPGLFLKMSLLLLCVIAWTSCSRFLELRVSLKKTFLRRRKPLGR